jgi:ABC-type lipoprotein release transport system permease subunit
MENILLVLTVFVGVGVGVLVVVLLMIAGTVLEARRRVTHLMDHYEREVAPHLGPLVRSAHSMVDDLAPKVRHISTNAVELSDILRTETQHITVSLSDVVERTHQQAARVDNIVSSTLNGIGHVTEVVGEGLTAPLRHLNGVLEGIRAGLGSFRRRDPSPKPPARPAAAAAAPIPTQTVVVLKSEEAGRPASNA